MIFRRGLFNAIAFAFFQSVSAVDFETDQQTNDIRLYTLYAVLGVIVVPVLIGALYARVIIGRLRQKSAVSDGKSKSSDRSLASSTAAAKSSAGSLASRILDMRSNPVVRLWWNRLDKMCGSKQETDLEAQLDTFAANGRSVSQSQQDLNPQLTQTSLEDPEAEKLPKKEKKKRKKNKLEYADNDSNIVDEEQELDADLAKDNETSSEKKHKKHKKKDKADLWEGFHESEADPERASLQKEKKLKKAKKAKAEVYPGLTQSEPDPDYPVVVPTQMRNEDNGMEKKVISEADYISRAFEGELGLAEMPKKGKKEKKHKSDKYSSRNDSGLDAESGEPEHQSDPEDKHKKQKKDKKEKVSDDTPRELQSSNGVDAEKKMKHKKHKTSTDGEPGPLSG